MLTLHHQAVMQMLVCIKSIGRKRITNDGETNSYQKLPFFKSASARLQGEFNYRQNDTYYSGMLWCQVYGMPALQE